MANVTIDDSDPSIIYLPAWNTRNASVPCPTCTANPQADLMFDETWHDSTVRYLHTLNLDAFVDFFHHFSSIPLLEAMIFRTFLSRPACCLMVSFFVCFAIAHVVAHHGTTGLFKLGTAMYVFCALAESSTSPDGDSNMSFYIDGDLKGTFVKIAPGNVGVYDYNVPVFAIDSLTPEEHNFTLQGGHVNGFKSLVLLDRMVYT